MGINNNKFRFGTIAGIRPGITPSQVVREVSLFRVFYTFPFPYFNHLKYFPGLPEAIEKSKHRIKTIGVRKNV